MFVTQRSSHRWFGFIVYLVLILLFQVQTAFAANPPSGLQRRGILAGLFGSSLPGGPDGGAGIDPSVVAKLFELFEGLASRVATQDQIIAELTNKLFEKEIAERVANLRRAHLPVFKGIVRSKLTPDAPDESASSLSGSQDILREWIGTRSDFEPDLVREIDEFIGLEDSSVKEYFALNSLKQGGFPSDLRQISTSRLYAWSEIVRTQIAEIGERIGNSPQLGMLQQRETQIGLEQSRRNTQIKALEQKILKKLPSELTQSADWLSVFGGRLFQLEKALALKYGLLEVEVAELTELMFRSRKGTHYHFLRRLANQPNFSDVYRDDIIKDYLEGLAQFAPSLSRELFQFHLEYLPSAEYIKSQFELEYFGYQSFDVQLLNKKFHRITSTNPASYLGANTVFEFLQKKEGQSEYKEALDYLAKQVKHRLETLSGKIENLSRVQNSTVRKNIALHLAKQKSQVEFQLQTLPQRLKAYIGQNFRAPHPKSSVDLQPPSYEMSPQWYTFGFSHPHEAKIELMEWSAALQRMGIAFSQGMLRFERVIQAIDQLAADTLLEKVQLQLRADQDETESPVFIALEDIPAAGENACNDLFNLTL